MSDISIVFPRWMIAWIWLGEAVPVTTLVMLGLGAAFLLGRCRVRLRRWLRWPVAIVPAVVAAVAEARYLRGYPGDALPRRRARRVGGGGGELQRCTLAEPTVVAAEVADAAGGRITLNLACAAGRDIDFRVVGHRLLEHCVLAGSAEVGGVACAGGKNHVVPIIPDHTPPRSTRCAASIPPNHGAVLPRIRRSTRRQCASSSMRRSTAVRLVGLSLSTVMAGLVSRLSDCGLQASLSMPSWSGREACPCEGRGPTIHEFACIGLDLSLQETGDRRASRPPCRTWVDRRGLAISSC